MSDRQSLTRLALVAVATCALPPMRAAAQGAGESIAVANNGPTPLSMVAASVHLPSNRQRRRNVSPRPD